MKIKTIVAMRPASTDDVRPLEWGLAEPTGVFRQGSEELFHREQGAGRKELLELPLGT